MANPQDRSESVLVRYRNRDIRPSDIAFIKSVMTSSPGMCRTALSRSLCSAWNWLQPDGALKECACRDLLLRLEEWGFLNLPPRLCTNGNGKRRVLPQPDMDIKPEPIASADIGRLVVRPIRDRQERLLWRSLVDRYHYLGDRVICGEHLLYVACLPAMGFDSENIVACLGWGAAALRNPKRDAWLGWNFDQARTRLHCIVNNQRFLILPWVRIKNLGSRILSLNWRRLSTDWQARYGHPVFLAETFVDVSRFHGTVYKAANWRFLGLTAGRSKRGNEIGHERGRTKAIFVYPDRPGRKPSDWL